jgi:hypothetical protein
LRLGSDGEEEGGEAEEEDNAFEAHGPDVQAVEFEAEGIVAGSGIHRDHLVAERRHARGDKVLRECGEQPHDNGEHHRRLDERFKGWCEREPSNDVDERGDDAEVMEATERHADKGAGLIAALECGEGTGSDDETEEDDCAEPGAEGEYSEEAEDICQHEERCYTGI